MKSHYLGVSVIAVAMAGLWLAGGGTKPPSAQASEQLRVEAPVGHDNLRVFFVHGPSTIDDSRVVGLQEAIEKKWVIVHETGEVNTLAIENVSADRDVFVQSGDMIRGGKQDRLIATDMLVRPGAGKLPVPSHCVEQGRWTGRGGEATTHFHTSNNFAVGNEIKLANAYRDQGLVWQEVAKNQTKLTTNTGAVVADPQSPTSLQLTLENPVVQAKVADYERTLKASGENRAGVVGAVFVVNGKVTSAEIYGSSGLFQKAWPKLLRAAAAEAIADKKHAETNVPSCREVEMFLATAATAEPHQPRPTGGVSGQNNPDNVVNPNGRGGRTMLLNDNIGNAVYGESVEAPQGVTTNRGDVRRNFNTPQAHFQQVTLPSPQPLQSEPQLNRNPARPQTRNPRVAAAPAEANPTGVNPLNTNRVDNRGSLMLESRDVTNQNAVIHRSYIKK